MHAVCACARQDHGHARIDSEQGRGTTVLLYLPPERGVGAESDDGVGDVEQAEQVKAGRTLVVAEDDAAVRMFPPGMALVTKPFALASLMTKVQAMIDA